MLIDPKVDDRVVCVDNYDVHGERDIPLDLIYIIKEVRNNFGDCLIIVTNDGKDYGPYYPYRFRTLKEVRKIKLEKLNSIYNG